MGNRVYDAFSLSGSTNTSMSTQLTLKVPDGTSGGTILNVKQNGIKYKVAVPEGLQPGDQFTADLGPHNEVGPSPDATPGIIYVGCRPARDIRRRPVPASNVTAQEEDATNVRMSLSSSGGRSRSGGTSMKMKFKSSGGKTTVQSWKKKVSSDGSTKETVTRRVGAASQTVVSRQAADGSTYRNETVDGVVDGAAFQQLWDSLPANLQVFIQPGMD